MSIELSRRAGLAIGTDDDPPDLDFRMRLARAATSANKFSDLSKEFQDYIKTAESVSR